MICVYGVGCVPVWAVSILMFLGLTSLEACLIVGGITALFGLYCFYKFYKKGYGVMGSFRKMVATLIDVIGSTICAIGNGAQKVLCFVGCQVKKLAAKVAGDTV